MAVESTTPMASINTNSNLSRNPHLAPSFLAPRSRSATPTGTGPRLSSRPQNHGSATQTLTPSRSESPNSEPLVLRLRGAHSPRSSTQNTSDEIQGDSNSNTRRRRQIQWAETVIDNEGLGRKKSKVCCIYHKPRAVGESSSEEDSSSSDSDASSDESDGARSVGGKRGRGKNHNHDHDGDDCGHSHDHGHGSRRQPRKPSPNAYEKMPRYDVKPLSRQPGSGL